MALKISQTQQEANQREKKLLRSTFGICGQSQTIDISNKQSGFKCTHMLKAGTTSPLSGEQDDFTPLEIVHWNITGSILSDVNIDLHISYY